MCVFVGILKDKLHSMLTVCLIRMLKATALLTKGVFRGKKVDSIVTGFQGEEISLSLASFPHYKSLSQLHFAMPQAAIFS